MLRVLIVGLMVAALDAGAAAAQQDVDRLLSNYGNEAASIVRPDAPADLSLTPNQQWMCERPGFAQWLRCGVMHRDGSQWAFVGSRRWFFGLTGQYIGSKEPNTLLMPRDDAATYFSDETASGIVKPARPSDVQLGPRESWLCQHPPSAEWTKCGATAWRGGRLEYVQPARYFTLEGGYLGLTQPQALTLPKPPAETPPRAVSPAETLPIPTAARDGPRSWSPHQTNEALARQAYSGVSREAYQRQQSEAITRAYQADKLSLFWTLVLIVIVGGLVALFHKAMLRAFYGLTLRPADSHVRPGEAERTVQAEKLAAEAGAAAKTHLAELKRAKIRSIDEAESLRGHRGHH